MGVIKKIFNDHWNQFVAKHPKMIRQSVHKEVNRMLSCGLIENGFTVYRCGECDSEVLVPFTCKSRFCTSCGKLYRDKWAEKLESRLINAPHKHLVFTIPQELRIYFRKDRALLKDLSDRAAKVLKETVYEMNKTQRFETGIISVIHSFGRDLKWNPHVHIIMSLRCLGKTQDRTIRYLNYKKLRMFWQKELLDLMKKRVPTAYMRSLINRLYRQKENGFYVYAKGEITNLQVISKYLARYAGRPAIAESRIINYDGQSLTITYVPHGESKEVEETLTAEEFIQRLIIHIPETHFKMMRNYGIYSRNNGRAKRIERRLVSKEKYERLKRIKTWQFRLMLEYDRNPLKCECGGLMKWDGIVVPKEEDYIERYRWKDRNAS